MRRADLNPKPPKRIGRVAISRAHLFCSGTPGNPSNRERQWHSAEKMMAPRTCTLATKSAMRIGGLEPRYGFPHNLSYEFERTNWSSQNLHAMWAPKHHLQAAIPNGHSPAWFHTRVLPSWSSIPGSFGIRPTPSRFRARSSWFRSWARSAPSESRRSGGQRTDEGDQVGNRIGNSWAGGPNTPNPLRHFSMHGPRPGFDRCRIESRGRRCSSSARRNGC